MYKVIKYFTDLHDKNHPYNVGDTFPRNGIRVTEKRLKELSGSDNRQGVPLIELVKEEVPEETEAVQPAEMQSDTQEVQPAKAPAKKTTTRKSGAKTSTK